MNNVCNYKIENKKDYLNHQIEIHNETIYPAEYWCYDCELIIKGYLKYLNHMNQEHEDVCKKIREDSKKSSKKTLELRLE